MKIKITYPSVSDYMERVVRMAEKSGKSQWWELTEDNVDASDRDQFTFIQMAVWDQLWEMEFQSESSPPPLSTAHLVFHPQPGDNPGCAVFGGVNWWRRTTQSLYNVA
jgi:hypothetical protein